MVSELAAGQTVPIPRRARRRRRPVAETALVRVDDAKRWRGPGKGRARGMGRLIRLASGWVIFGVGVIFVILPVIPGTPLVILAAVLLAPDVPVFARVLDWSKSRFSHVTAKVNAYNERFADDFNRRFED